MKSGKILPLLVQADAEHPSFHVVALSLPGYGFSEAPKKSGFELKQFAEVCTIVNCCTITNANLQVGNKLMLALGYNEYGRWCCICAEACIHVQIYLVTQGGDWGHMVRSNQLLNKNSQSNLDSHRLHER